MTHAAFFGAAVTAHLLVVAGQSNALGHHSGEAFSPPPAWWVDTPRVQVWADSDGDGQGDRWEAMRPGQNTGNPAAPSAWGPEVAFAYAWLREHPNETLWIVRSAKGSTSLGELADPAGGGPANDWTADELFARTTATLERAKATLAGPIDTTVLWFQGESDAADGAPGGWADQYAANLAVLRADAAVAWDADRFLMARIHTGLAGNGEVQAAQVEGFNTGQFHRWDDDPLHLSDAGQIDSGFSFYALYDRTALVVTAGGSGDGIYVGSTGQDSVAAGAGNDALYGGSGQDWLHGNTGADVLYGGSGADTLYGGQHDDRISGDDGWDFIQGNLGDDTLAGGWGADILHGGQGADVLTGGSGADSLSGDRGDDTLTGGTGADRFYIFAGCGADVVLDFDGAAGDRILLAPGTAYTLATVGGATVIGVSGGSATLAGVTHFDPGWIT